MKQINFFRITLLLLIIVTVCTTVYADSRFEQISCMEVRVLTDENQIVCREQTDKDLSGYFFFKNEPAAVDQENRTIYISQNISNATRYQDLEGNLTLAYKNFRLYFTPDPCFSDLKSAMAQSHPFRLLAVSPAGEYAEYAVVFTSLPVLTMDAKSSDQNERYLFGDICLWDPNNPEQLRYSITSGSAEWHIRGATTSGMPKSSWKLSLKTSRGEKTEFSMLGLGKDDDWLLNGMSMDDTDLKERLFMDLWNEMVLDTSYNHSMSTGRYVEVIINREYKGLFLLQRRVDSNYLNLPADAILIKGISSRKQDLIQDNYEIVSSPFSDTDTFALLQDLWEGDCSMFDVDNFVDYSLFIHFASAPDNAKLHNLFFVLEPTSSGYSVRLIPWDTDMSFGSAWINGFSYDYEKSLKSSARRIEFEQMQKLYPDLDNRLSSRWQDLRKKILSEENILAHLSVLEAQISESGASIREHRRWEDYSAGKDTIENLYRYIEEKLPLVDEFYTQ